MVKPYKPARLVFPVTAQTIQALNDVIEDVYQRLKESAADSDATPGAYGDASHVPSITIDELGRVTNLTEIAIAIAANAIVSGTIAAARMPAFSGDVTTLAGGITTTIANDAVTYAKMQNVSAASKLLGRGDASAGDPQEITLGSGLAMSGTTLSASGGGSGSLVLLEQHTASASASLDFTTAFTSTYDDYVIEIIDLVPATVSTDLLLRFSLDGGATWQTTAYQYVGIANSTGNVGISSSGIQSASAAAILLFTLIDNTASYGVNGRVNFRNPLGTTLNKAIDFALTAPLKTGATQRLYFTSGGGFWGGTSAVNAIQFLMSSGNLTSGTIRIYGLVK